MSKSFGAGRFRADVMLFTRSASCRGAEREADPELAAACRPYHSDDLGEQPPFSITARQSRASCSCGGEYHQDATSNEQVRTQCVCCHFVVDSSRCDGLDGENCDGYEAVLSNDSDFLAMDIPGWVFMMAVAS